MLSTFSRREVVLLHPSIFNLHDEASAKFGIGKRAVGNGAVAVVSLLVAWIR